MLRARPIDAPFALTHRQSNTERVYCLNLQALEHGVQKGTGLGEARVLCPGLQTVTADTRADARFLHMLARWAGQYCPWVGIEQDGLALDITGSAHLRGGELALLEDMSTRLSRAGISALAGLADTRGAAWALARHKAQTSNNRPPPSGPNQSTKEAISAPRPPSVLPVSSGGVAVKTRSAAPHPNLAGISEDHERRAVTGRNFSAMQQGSPFAIAPPGGALAAIAPLPVAALRLPTATCSRLQRLGIRTVKDVSALPRSSLSRRFGAEVLLRLDQALGAVAEPVTPLPPPAPFAFSMTLPEPIGLLSDIEAGLARLLTRLCARLETAEKGARRLVFTARRVDQGHVQAEVRLARPMRDATRMARLFERGLEGLDSGYGIDRIRLEAVELEALPLRQTSRYKAPDDDGGLADIITRLGNRIGLENITRVLPADSHLPEKSFSVLPAAYSKAAGGWAGPAPRPMLIFAPEPIAGHGPQPPERFRWRRLWFRVAKAIGPERIAPEWWFDHPEWRSGVRDYWRVLTQEGRRLWLYFTPQNPGWFVQGEFA